MIRTGIPPVGRWRFLARMPSADEASNVVKVTTGQEKACHLRKQLCVHNVCLAEGALRRVACGSLVVDGVEALVVGGWAEFLWRGGRPRFRD